MAFTEPVARSAFFSKLRVQNMEFRIARYSISSGTGGHALITSEIAPPRWTADIRLRDQRLSESRATVALLNAIGENLKFSAYDKTRQWPLADPNGTIVAGTNPTIFAIGTDRIGIRFTGLPSGYALGPGDLFSFSASGRIHLHEIIDGGTATGSGTTPTIEIRPALASGATSGQAVEFRQPYVRMRILPGTLNTGWTDGYQRSSMGFSAVEVR